MPNRQKKFKKWLENVKYLPKFMRDFHDAKDLFKTMHFAYENQPQNSEYIKNNMPTWVDGQCYVIDWFLFFMAVRGYTLQKSKKKFDFDEYEVWTQRNEMMKTMSKNKDTAPNKPRE